MTAIEKVELAIDSIRPYLKADGGDIKVLEVTEDQVVKVELLGSCGDCPMSSMTLKAGVEDAIKKAMPEINRVEAVNLVS
jgi:Fe-S cluster biogenesis protein NfuA